MGAFDHQEWTYDGAFEQLLGLGRGEFEQKFSKNSNARGVARGGMLKLRFDWYIIFQIKTVVPVRSPVMSWLYMSVRPVVCHQLRRDEPQSCRSNSRSLVWQQRSPIDRVGKSQAMNRRLFYVVTAILVALTVYLVSINLNKLPDERTRAPRNYLKEDKQADVKGRNPLFWEVKITSLFRCWLKIVFPSGKLFIFFRK